MVRYTRQHTSAEKSLCVKNPASVGVCGCARVSVRVRVRVRIRVRVRVRVRVIVHVHVRVHVGVPVCARVLVPHLVTSSENVKVRNA